MPVAPLMIEHRLIERMIALMAKEVERMDSTREARPAFIDTAVDFIRTYADRTHHGKEEDILFRDLAAKDISDEHKAGMQQLIDEHVWARGRVGELVHARNRYAAGESGALKEIRDLMAALAAFYPKHIEMEDRRFFIPCMRYFSDGEKEAMLAEMNEFDRQLIHEIYGETVVGLEGEAS